MFWENLIANYESLLQGFATIAATTLEFIGVFIVTLGSVTALVRLARRHIRHQPGNAVLELGRTLSIALEFKMGAEIINTVLFHELSELAVLGVVIVLRALLAFLIHWEIQLEKKEEAENKPE